MTNYRFIKMTIFALATVLLGVFVLSGCSIGKLNTGSIDRESDQPTLSVITMYAGDDANARNYRESIETWSRENGIIVDDNSVTSNEAFKNRVLMDFRTGAEPDVLFFFNGVDANPFVEAGKVVSLDEIREIYPDYATNMKESMMKPSPFDGRIYSIPVNGYWEGLYVNLKVCQAAGVKVPDETTTWDEFIEICRQIKASGYTPIAASLASVPHYWFEFCIYNHQTVDTHPVVPDFLYDRYGLAWMKGVNDIKFLYGEGFLPHNTLTASDDETTRQFLDGQAAFLLDGSWRLASIEERQDRDDFVVTYLPGQGKRLTTDIIGGLSSGYYITRKAWDNPEKRAAAVSFVKNMTSDELVSKFAGSSATALVNGVKLGDEEPSKLTLSALYMIEHATGVSEAVQDLLPVAVRSTIFDNIPAMVIGDMPADELVQAVIRSIELCIR